jgi:hypothetical protein
MKGFIKIMDKISVIIIIIKIKRKTISSKILKYKNLLKILLILYILVISHGLFFFIMIQLNPI